MLSPLTRVRSTKSIERDATGRTILDVIPQGAKGIIRVIRPVYDGLAYFDYLVTFDRHGSVLVRRGEIERDATPPKDG